MESNIEKIKSDLAKAVKDSDFWRQHYEALEVEHKKLTAELAQRTTGDSQANAKMQAALSDLRDMSDERNMALGLLRELREHVGARDGNFHKSTTFCAVCENPRYCPLSKVTELIGG